MLEVVSGEAAIVRGYLAQVLQQTDDAIRADLAETGTAHDTAPIDRAAAWRLADNYLADWGAQIVKPFPERRVPTLPTDPLVSTYLGPMIENWPSALEHGTADLARVKLALVELAAYEYRSAEGRALTDLTDLLPEYLASIPEDPFNAAPLRLGASRGTPVIYSVGPDGVDGVAAQDASADDIVVELQP